MAYTLDDKCAKNDCKRRILHHLIVEDVGLVTCFLRQCRQRDIGGGLLEWIRI